jgi:hypothetical protein
LDKTFVNIRAKAVVSKTLTLYEITLCLTNVLSKNWLPLTREVYERFLKIASTVAYVS